ncbi:alkaline phosphatase family protein [Streptomyces sp. WMMC500]|uniref:alkaline phosphatase family protein n=1 Tax=Streptomyces sp. WMMC500 TaxID=3015154 RepID=UPI00248AFB9B|nr:alkaline phosphatase family protein [Streptomyces sp. WMMC500]WBB63322.1 alkaline phosphatase family protein [Streptomyces sp. WMMC500]
MRTKIRPRTLLTRFGAAALVLLTAVATVSVSDDSAAAGRPAGPAGNADDRPPADHVVFLGLDGFDYEYLDDVPMPNLQDLLRRGTVAKSRGVMTSITNPSWSSIATGAWPATHRNTAYWFDKSTHTARGQQRDLAVPTVAQSIREQGGTVFSSQWFIVQNYGTSYGDTEGLYTDGGDCPTRVGRAVAVMEGRPVSSGGKDVTLPRIPELMAAYCDDLDALGHAGGSIHPEIPDRLRMIDEQIGRLVQAARNAGIYDRTAFVITGDHGMTTFQQGMAPELLKAIGDAGYQAEILTSGKQPGPGTDAALVIGGSGDLTLLGDAADDPWALPRIRRAVESLPHVAATYDKRTQKRMHMSLNHGDLVIEPEEGWSLGETTPAPVGRHGTTQELDVPLVLAGAGVSKWIKPWHPRHIDIAPTMSALLGMEPPAGAEGRVLRESVRPR